MKFRDYVVLTINGQEHTIKGDDAFRPLSSLLRYQLGLTGTKIVCAEGDCGACTIMFKRYLGPSLTNDKFQSMNSCISTTFLLDMTHIISVEGLSQKNHLSEIQNSMIQNFGGQCGFCTPGFVMSLTNLYENAINIDEQKVKNYLTGNLCRCTGYQPILNAALAVDSSRVRPLSNYFNFKNLNQSFAENLDRPIRITIGDREFFAPTTLAMAADYKKKNPNVRLFSGATDIGVQINKGKMPGIKLMSLHLIQELYELRVEGEQVVVGARVSLSALQVFLKDKSPKFADFLNIFASPQIKNAATLVGNLANGSPIADTTPYLLTADGSVELAGATGKRSLPLSEFIKGYKSFDLKDDEFITHIRFNLPTAKNSRIGLFKVSQRRDLDISCVNSSFIFNVKDNFIEKAKIAYGGVGPKALRLFEVESLLEGKTLNTELVNQAKELIAKAITPLSDLRGSAEFRQHICIDLFDRFIQENFN